MSTYITLAAATALMALGAIAPAQGGAGPIKLTGASIIEVDNGSHAKQAKNQYWLAKPTTYIPYTFTVELNIAAPSATTVYITDTLQVLHHPAYIVIAQGSKYGTFVCWGMDAPFSGTMYATNSVSQAPCAVQTVWP